ncbi:MAG: LCP family protein [Anaerolineae bacterium]
MSHKSIRREKSRLPTILTALLILIFAAVTIAAALFLVSWGRGQISDSGILPGVGAASGSESPYVERRPGQVIPTWTGTDRVTVLVLGVDERQQESGPFRTDTIMLLTLNPVTLEAGVLSIPRDLWVPIPGYNEGRINTAHFLGDLYDYPGGGPALAMETVEYNLGVPVNYYVRLNFQGFIDLVDLIGGIDVYVDETIHDEAYPTSDYGVELLHIEAGQHHFDGEMALKYARSRHGSSDFDRARRQQKVLLAILDRVTSLEMLPQLASRANEIFTTVEDSLATDLTLDEILALGGLALQVDRNEIRFGVIDEKCTNSWTTPTGGQVLIPIRDCMREVRNYVFGTSDTAGAPSVEEEEATVAVLNGTEEVGLASRTAQYLKENGLQIALFGNAEQQDYATTTVILNRPKPATANRILELLGLPESALANGANPTADQDVLIILGADYQGPPTPIPATTPTTTP